MIRHNGHLGDRRKWLQIGGRETFYLERWGEIATFACQCKTRSKGINKPDQVSGPFTIKMDFVYSIRQSVIN